MRRIALLFVSLAAGLAIPALLLAQSEVGTWKLNVSKSKYSGVATPKSRTQTLESRDGEIRTRTEGVAGDGSPINYNHAGRYDGKDNPIAGSGAPNGADSVAHKRIDERTTETTYKKSGKLVATARSSISKDGKTMTVTAKGTGPDGKKTNVRAVYEKQ